MVELYHGDCLEVLKTLAENSVDSIVSDPPAGISFMANGNKDHWDSDKGGRDQWIAWLTDIMAESLRVLKPGGHMLIWALPRVSHWTATAIENAGFEVRDIVHHLFSSGMPHGLDVAKAIDKQAGVQQDVIGTRNPSVISKKWRAMEGRTDRPTSLLTVTAPTSDDAKTWAGWGTALKPAAEHWILARKPINAKNIAQNVLQHGTGAINIDATRVPPAVGESTSDAPIDKHPNYKNKVYGRGHGGSDWALSSHGRWPANVVLSHSDQCVHVGRSRVKATKARDSRTPITPANTYGTSRNSGLGGYGASDGYETVETWECADDCPAKAIDTQGGGTSKSTRSQRGKVKIFDKERYGVADSGWRGDSTERGFDDEGGASRFFMRFIYCSKASPNERGQANNHPTVKSLDLMQYLVLLITPPNGTALDPFMGTGSTGLACIRQGFNFIGIEKEQPFFDIAYDRISGDS